jgi:broad specificity phosphatase PhoE
VAEIVLCRHAATEHNLSKRFLSTTDLPLGSHGRDQCAQLAAALRRFHFDRCLVSPMLRCLETRALIAPQIAFAVVPALREVDFGTWEGHTQQWAEEHAPELLAARRKDPVHFRPPGGESIADAAERLRPLATSLGHDESTLIVSHRLTLGIFERLIRGLPLDSKSVEPLETAQFRVVPA